MLSQKSIVLTLCSTVPPQNLLVHCRFSQNVRLHDQNGGVLSAMIRLHGATVINIERAHLKTICRTVLMIQYSSF